MYYWSQNRDCDQSTSQKNLDFKERSEILYLFKVLERTYGHVRLSDYVNSIKQRWKIFPIFLLLLTTIQASGDWVISRIVFHADEIWSAHDWLRMWEMQIWVLFMRITDYTNLIMRLHENFFHSRFNSYLRGHKSKCWIYVGYVITRRLNLGNWVLAYFTLVCMKNTTTKVCTEPEHTGYLYSFLSLIVVSK